MRHAFVAGLVMGILGTAMTAAPDNDPVRDARDAVAPTGTLRAGVNLGNALFMRRHPSTGALEGVAVDLMAALGARLGVSVTHVVHASPGDVAASAGADTWDVAILAIEPARADVIRFSSPMTEIQATYVVASPSGIIDIAQVDQPGRTVAAAPRTGYELFLTRTLKQADLVRPPTNGEAIAMLRRGAVDAVAGLAPTLHETHGDDATLRVLGGGFTTVNHGVGVPKTRVEAAARAVDQFVRELLASGELARMIERHQVRGLRAVGP
jgi:polar amino acid transport system substrate-binding protein